MSQLSGMIRIVGAAVLLGLATMIVPGDGADLPGPNQAKIEAFLQNKGWESAGWGKQPAHLSGADVNGTLYIVHKYIEVHYSPGIGKWINGPAKTASGLADNEMIVALEYAPVPGNPKSHGELLRIRSMVRKGGGNKGGSHDGWFWSTTVFKNGQVDRSTSEGGFGVPECLGCHASADNDGMVFLSKQGPLPMQEASKWTPDAEFKWRTPVALQRARIKPMPQADPAFLAYFDVEDVQTAVPFPSKAHDHVWAGSYAGMSMHEKESYITSNQCMACHNAGQLLSNTSPNMWYPEPDPETTLVDGEKTPDSRATRNFSPYGEWSASLNALSGRDPVWHAQVDFERKLRPELAHFTTDTCFLCHGPMAQRQIKLDKGKDQLFTIDMFYDTDGEFAKYGALARDGVSCAVCHQIGSKDLGVDPEFKPWQPKGAPKPTSGFALPTDFKTYTAMFPDPDLKNPRNRYSNGYFGPYPDEEIQSLLMDRSLGFRAKWGAGDVNELTTPQIHESKLCGSCHTVLVPALPVGYKLPEGIANPFEDPHMKMSFEQTTYFEWRNSQYENEMDPNRGTAITCQGCHMASHKDTPKRIVNAESDRFPPVRGRAEGSVDFIKHNPIYRHVLLGINFFVFEMYEQFADLLGAQHIDARVPDQTLDPTLNARDWIENHADKITADLRITDLQENAVIDGKNFLEAEVEVTNFAGHKFPTGAGFRRAFIQFEVLDADGAVLWASGRTNSLGVLLGPDNKPLASEETVVPKDSQSHHQIITRQDQVQIYETRALDSEVKLQTTVLGIYYEYKDNRILPIGFQVPHEDAPVAHKATVAALTGVVANQPVGVQTMPPAGVSEEATEHPTVLDNGQRPFEVVYDPDYWLPSAAARGQDHVRYRVPLDQIQGWSRIRARLFYQTIPPYYLRDRFQTGQPDRFPKERDMNRLIHIASRLNLKGTPAENWRLAIGTPAEKAKGAAPDPKLSQAETLEKLKAHYNYLSLR